MVTKQVENIPDGILTAQCSRRTFVRTLMVASLPMFIGTQGCERHRYVRPGEELDLGTVRELLYSVVHVRTKSILVFRDADGWRALSTRCSYNGCDLTYQEPILLCPCCRSTFDMDGVPERGGLARRNLPWVKIEYKEGHLFAQPGEIVSSRTRFTTPEIEEAIRKLRERIKQEGVGDEVKIPEVLMGQGSGEGGGMFLEDDPNLIHELDMIK